MPHHRRYGIRLRFPLLLIAHDLQPSQLLYKIEGKRLIDLFGFS